VRMEKWTQSRRFARCAVRHTPQSQQQSSGSTNRFSTEESLPGQLSTSSFAIPGAVGHQLRGLLSLGLSRQHRMCGAVLEWRKEHRFVQRLLGRFRSQGFVHHDSTRACVALTKEPVTRVIADRVRDAPSRARFLATSVVDLTLLSV
jgi:hypothetical protein